jgi:DM9 repeat
MKSLSCFVAVAALLFLAPAAAQAQWGGGAWGDAHSHWVKDSDGQIDSAARPAGHEANGQRFFVCKARFNGGVHPGKIRMGFDGCHIGWGGHEHSVSDYWVYVGEGRWVDGGPGADVPHGAVHGGHEADGRQLFVCRAEYNGSLDPGKVGVSTGGCNIGWGGREISLHDYEVLVHHHDDRDGWDN